MSIEITADYLRRNLSQLPRRVCDDCETVVVRRKGGRDVAIVAADEWASLNETAYLLRSPANARRLLQALERSKSGEGKPEPLSSLHSAFTSKRSRSHV